MRIGTLSLLAAMFSFPAAANECLIEKHQQFTQASIGWYQALNKILVDKHPELADTAQRYLQVQTITAQEMHIAVKHMLESDRENVHTDKPLNQWIDLSANLKTELTQNDDSFSAFQVELIRLKEGMGTKVDYPLRTAMANMFTQSKSTEQAFNTYLQRVTEIETQSCE